MLSRLRYLLAEGFEVSQISGEDAIGTGDRFGKCRITYVVTDTEGRRRLVSEEFEVSGKEAEVSAILFVKSLRA